MKRLIGALLGACVVAALAVIPSAIGKDKPPVIMQGSQVEVQILALNDFHGNLLPPTRIESAASAPSTPAGPSTSRRTSRTCETTNANTIVVSAGDLIGASPLLSALFHDEPTIEAMNAIGLDLNAVGNHEFDEGTTELLRMQNGGCHPVDGCQDGDGVRGRGLPVPGGQRRQRATGKTLFPPYDDPELQRREGRVHRHDARGHAEHRQPVRRRGLRLPGRGGHRQRAVPELRSGGRRARSSCSSTRAASPTALEHQRLRQASAGRSSTSSSRLSTIEVDLVVSGHTHQPYICVIDGKP